MNDFDQPPQPLPELRGGSLVIRFALIVVIIGAIAGAFLYASGLLTPHALSPTVIVDTFEQTDGKHPGFRRNHAKGVCFTGYFEGNGRGVALSKASVFGTGRVPVLGRFSFAGGQPYNPDAPQSVRSMAVLFQLPDGQEWRIAAVNLPVFPVNTPENFHEFQLATAPDAATGKPDPAKIGAFFGKHPESAKAIGLIQKNPLSSGFTDASYNSLNAFRLVNAAGVSVPFRWTMVAAEPFVPFDPAQTHPPGTNYLFDALIAAVHAKPLKWNLVFTLGQPEDSTTDATTPWPAEREQIVVGTLTVDHIESEETSPARDITFDPLILPDGITTSDDPLLSARSAAYAQSFTRREGEPKSPSAVSTAETGK